MLHPGMTSLSRKQNLGVKVEWENTICLDATDILTILLDLLLGWGLDHSRGACFSPHFLLLSFLSLFTSCFPFFITLVCSSFSSAFDPPTLDLDSGVFLPASATCTYWRSRILHLHLHSAFLLHAQRRLSRFFGGRSLFSFGNFLKSPNIMALLVHPALGTCQRLIHILSCGT